MENLNGNDSGAASAASSALIEEREANKLPDLKTAIGGRFKIIESLGDSETYSQFLARDDVGNLIRLKVLSEIAALDSRKIDLFYLEAFAASRLIHPNIARTNDPEYFASTHFCTSEHYSDVVSLRSLLDKRGWLPPELAASIAGRIAEALEYAHARDVLHLNLHPENVLIGADGRVIVTGFGIGANPEWAWARRERSRQLPAQYISPEQAQEIDMDHPSDLYSLGILLFEMLTDRVPFDSLDREVVKRKQIAHAPQAPQVFRPGVSALQSALVMSLLEKSPDKRCSSATQLRSVLSSLAGPEHRKPDERSAQLPTVSQHPVYEDTRALPVHQKEEEAEPRPVNTIESAASEITPSEQEQNPAAKREAFEPPTITVIDPPLNPSEDSNANRSSRQVSIHKVDVQKRLTSEPASRSRGRWAMLVLLSAIVAVLMSILLARGNQLSKFLQKARPAQTEPSPPVSPLQPETITPVAAQAEVEKKDSVVPNDVGRAARKPLWRTQPVARSQPVRAKRAIYRSQAAKINQSSKRKFKSSRALWLRQYKRH